MKKILSLVLSLVLCAALAVPTLAETTYPLTTDTTLDVWFADISYSSTFTSAEEGYLFQALEAQTGVNINWIEPAAGADATTAYNLMMASGELPDIIWSADIFTNGETYLNDEVIIDLTDLINEENTPALMAYINKDYDMSVLNNVKTSDGRVFGFPNFTYCNPWNGTYVRQDWLTECGLDLPVTIDDWTEMLTVFNEKYGAQLSTVSGADGFFNNFVGAYGAVGVNENDGFFMAEDGATVVYSPATEGYKEYLTLMNSWYEAGLIDPDYLSNDQTILISKCVEGKVGAMIGYQVTDGQISLAANDDSADWVAVATPRLTADGEPALVQAGLTVLNYATAITTSCEDVETALKFIDYLYTDAGMILMNYGIEGESFYYDENGDICYTDEFMNGPEGMVEYARRYTGIAGNVPGRKTAEAAYARNDEASNLAESTWIDGQEANSYARSGHYLPNFSATAEETEETTDRLSALNTFVKENTYKFITGERSLDEFDAFVAELTDTYEMNVVLEIRQAQVDRALGK